jgi:hypothetical protein
MTVCIAAVCDLGEPAKIVLCADWLRSNSFGKSDTTMKIRPIFSNWYVLGSGDEGEINIVYLKLRSAFISAKTIDETNICRLVQGALAERKKEIADQVVRGRFGISFDELLNVGKEKFPDDILRETLSAVRQARCEYECLIAGFYDSFAVLVTASGDGTVSILEDFAVAGEGSYLAQTVLLHRQHSESHSLAQTLYTVYEAKKYAEGASSVGQKYSIRIIEPGKKPLGISTSGRKSLEEQYKKFGPQPIDSALTTTNDMFFEMAGAGD